MNAAAIRGILLLLFACLRNELVFAFIDGGGRRIAPQRASHSNSNMLNPLAMRIKVGIVGLPNTGKSTLFNTLAQKAIAQAANFPFCTIEPNVAPIGIPDEFLGGLLSLSGHERIAPPVIEWVDVAGLVRGASRGDGLGNQFLGTIRECDAICHVVRTFEDAETIHVDGKVDPLSDCEAINLELMLADLAHAERRLEKTTCKGEERAALEVVVTALNAGTPARAAGLSDDAAFSIKGMGLLTLKPVLYAFNVDEVDFTLDYAAAAARCKEVFSRVPHCDPTRDMWTIVSARLEYETAALESKEEQIAYLASLGMTVEKGRQGVGYINSDALDSRLDSGGLLSCVVLPSMVRRLLDLSVGYTGPGVPRDRTRTVKAHLFERGKLTAEGLAGKVHGDIQRGFIRAEVCHADDLLKHPNYAAAREAGLMRTEGRDYSLRDGDVVCVKWK